MSNPTPGPWIWHLQHNERGYNLVHPHRGWLLVMDFVRKGMQLGQPRFATWKGEDRGRMGGIMRPVSELVALDQHPDARLIAAAPAYKLALDMLMAGVARIERSPTCSFVEFCFDGLRYPVNGDDYGRVLDVIGWDKARAALVNAKGGVS